MLIRKIGKTLRGQAKPYQIIVAAILGGLIGFAPPMGNAPLYMVGVILLLAILNANFFIAAITGTLCKLLALLLMPVSFELGLVLVDGPLQPLFTTLINSPVTALMGFEYYVTAGGTVIGTIVGAGLGIAYIKLISNFRKKMASLEADSEKYATFAGKRSVRIVTWILFGGKAKMSYADLAEQKKIGNPVRPLGIAFAALALVFLFVVQQFFSGPLITTILRGQLEEFYGATVDIESVEIDLASGLVTVKGLAMADPDNLEYDLIRASELTAKISTSDLLRKRMTIDSIVIDDAQQGAKRDRPGVLIGDRTKKKPPTDAEGKSIEEWFEQAQKWKERLDTFRYWLEKVQGPPKDKETDETDEDWLRDWAERYGHAEVKAKHLIEGSPTVLVKEITLKKLRDAWPKDETLNIYATNLSTDPSLVDEQPNIKVSSSNDSLSIDVSLKRSAFAEDKNLLKLAIKNRSVDETIKDLDLGKYAVLTGGTWRVGIDGGWNIDDINLPLVFEIQNTDLTIPSIGKTIKDQTLPITFFVNGPMDSPRLSLDAEKLAATTLAIAKKELGDAAVDALRGKLKDSIGSEWSDKIEGVTGGIFGGDKDKDKDDKPDDDKKDKEDKLKDGAGKVIDGLFN